MTTGLIVSIQAEEFLARLRGAPQRLRAAMEAVVQRLSIMVQGKVKDKLTGQVLHVRSGTLRRSINRVVQSDTAGVVATVGTNVRYAAVHEYGFDGDVTVRAHVRRVASRSVGKGKKLSVQGVAFVREHTRHMHVPETSFLRSVLIESGAQIRADIKAAAVGALR